MSDQSSYLPGQSGRIAWPMAQRINSVTDHFRYPAVKADDRSLAQCHRLRYHQPKRLRLGAGMDYDVERPHCRSRVLKKAGECHPIRNS